jgi:hypothetical protein
MQKLISFLRSSPPSSMGFGDTVTVYDCDMAVIRTFSGRSTPNPFHPTNKTPWDLNYSCIQPGIYSGVFTRDAKNRLCIVINGGREIPAILPNPNHGYHHKITGAEIHSGFRDDDPNTAANESWPGSAACCTIAPGQWDDFCKLFRAGETVKVEIVAY